jgi:hypothetical protein
VHWKRPFVSIVSTSGRNVSWALAVVVVVVVVVVVGDRLRRNCAGIAT